MNIQTINTQNFIPISANRKPIGFLCFPYSFFSIIRYLFNYISNGFFSYKNPDIRSMHLLNKKGSIQVLDPIGRLRETSEIKILFLGDIMLSKSGNPFKIDNSVQKLLKSADLIIANVESPIVDRKDKIKRGLTLRFEMPISFLESIYKCNESAKWVFNIANNHALDTSNKNSKDLSGLIKTAKIIKQNIPGSEVIGANVGFAKSILSLKPENGPKIGVVGWSEIMNGDKKHFKKPVVRGVDLISKVVEKIKRDHNFLIGFAHGNEEQSYHPLKNTRDRWINLIDQDKFDLIVGHGPHVVQPSEKIKNRLLFHSIGNFCSPSGPSQTKIGLIPKITLKYDKENVIEAEYNMHILERESESISAFTLKNYHGKYSKIVNRLRKI